MRSAPVAFASRLIVALSLAHALSPNSVLAALQQGQQATWTTGGAPGSQITAKGTGSPEDAVGAVVTLASSATTNAVGGISTKLPADAYRGKRVRVSADVDARNVTGWTTLWVAAEGPNGPLVMDNGQQRALKGTATGHVQVTIVVPPEATTLMVAMLMSGSGEATANGLRLTSTAIPDAASISPEAKAVLDSAIALVRAHALWRDTVTWSAVLPTVRMLASGASKTEETYSAITYLLRRLGDNHSFHMPPSSTQSFVAGGASNPRPEVRTLEPGIGYISVPAYSGMQRGAEQSYARDVHAALEKVAPTASCGWVLDLRTNGGGNMWPMLNGLQPFLGNEGLGSFVSAEGSSPLWKAGAVGVTPPAGLAHLESTTVAVLTGPRTASSGEAVTISFRGRPNTRSFGLPTAGFSTANDEYSLPDGSMILLTVSVEADRTGKKYGHKVDPDQLVEPGKDGDSQIAAAVRWLRAQPACK